MPAEYPDYPIPNLETHLTQEEMDVRLAYYREHKNQLIQAAIFTAKNGVSHREIPFRVGCSLLTVGEDTKPDEYPVYFAYNFKPEPGNVSGWSKRCAERNAVQSALEHRTKAIIALVTASTETSTGDPDLAHDALHPCADCRKMLQELLQNGVLRNDSMICNANYSNPSDIKVEERTVEQLLELYKNNQST